MTLTGLHILLTYQCTFECDHCFVWGSPQQEGVFTLAQLRSVFDQAAEVPSIGMIYFEGGEPFLYQPILVAGVRAAHQRGFQVGIVTNGYWATTEEDAATWLEPMAGMISDLSISTDLLHYDQAVSPQSRHAQAACDRLGIPNSLIICDLPEGAQQPALQARGEPIEGGDIVYRGRAVRSFAAEAPKQAWEAFGECPHEQLDDPGRVHLDPLGNLHVCQGLVMGNLFIRPLSEIVAAYEPSGHPVLAPLLEGGPAELIRRFDLSHDPAYADACHLCYTARDQLRSRFPEALGPGQMYGDGLT